MQLTDLSRNAAVDAVVSLFDLGVANLTGRLNIYDLGKVNLLAEIVMNIPAFAAPIGGVSAMILIPDVQDNAANITGTAVVVEGVDRDNNVVCIGSVGTSGKDLNLNSVNLEAGVPVKITSCNFGQPAGTPK